MIPFIIRRLLWMVVLLLVISFLTFVIFYTLPAADPAALRAGRQPTPELIASIKHSLGLDRPWYIQYLKYLDRLVFHFDFGFSYQNQISVKSQIFDRLPATLALSVGAAAVWLLVGIPVGIISAIKRGTWMDRAAMGSAVYARFLRGNLLETMSEDYIRTARAKGLREPRVVFKHGVRSAITPIVTILGLDLGILLGGAILTETVFNIPGVGRLAYDAIQKSDLNTVQGTVLMGAFFIILLNLIVDIVYAFLDPRVRY